MNETVFVELCEHLTENIALQWILIVIGICFLEDVARCAVGLLVATDQLEWWFAFSGMIAGSLVGDLGLYLIGRYAMNFCVERRWINAERIERMKHYFSMHAIKAVFGARFFPGARSVAYLTAGATHYRFLNFFLILLAAAVSQALIFLYGTELFGERVLGYFESPRTRWIAGGIFLLLIVCTHFIVAKRNKARAQREKTG